MEAPMTPMNCRFLFAIVALSLISLPAPAGAQDAARENTAWVEFEAWAGPDVAKAVAMVRYLWNFELNKSADAKSVVTVGTIVGGIFLLGLGYLVARIV